MLQRVLTTIALISLAIGTAFAKGDFYAEGTVSDVRFSGDQLTFRFVGSVSFAYASAPLNDPKREWRSIKLDTVSVLVRIANWTDKNDASITDKSPQTKLVFEKLTALATGQKVLLAVANPNFAFAPDGLLREIEGTHVNAVPSPY